MMISDNGVIFLLIAAVMLSLALGCSTTDAAEVEEVQPEVAEAEMAEAEATDLPLEDDEPAHAAEPPSPDKPPAPDDPAPASAAGEGEMPDESDASDDAEEEAEEDEDESEERTGEVDGPEKRAVEMVEEKFSDQFRILTPVHIEGWTFIKMKDKRLSHPRPRCEVVREDATLVDGDKSGELLKVYEAMGVFDGELPSAFDMAIAANALIGDCRAPVRGEVAERRDGDFSDLKITAPRATRDGDTVTLLYFAVGSDYRDNSIYRGEAVFTADEILDASVDSIQPDTDIDTDTDDEEILDVF